MKKQNSNRWIGITGSLCAALFLALAGCSPQAAASPTIEFTETAVPASATAPLPTQSPVPSTATALPAEITDVKGAVMRLVPAGPFTMGSNDGMPDEKPVHKVDLPAFYMDKFEVTNALYEACVNAGACQAPVNTSAGVHPGAYGTYGNPLFDDYPVIWVDWDRAEAYCSWRGARLPGESEWEKAARGTDGRTYPWGETIDPSRANYGNNVPDDYAGALGKTTAVGSYPGGRSPYGIYDMAGNVWEWVADWYDVYPGGEQSANSAFGQKAYRVLRGGSWNDDPGLLRTTFRGGNPPDTAFNYIGFRCAQPIGRGKGNMSRK